MKKIFFGLIFSLLAFQVNAATINLNSSNAGSFHNFSEAQDFSNAGNTLVLDSSIANWNLDFSIQDISSGSITGFGLEVYSGGLLVATVTPPSSVITLAAGTYTLRFVVQGGVGANGLVIGTAAAVSGVPVPAAVWLFGSALMGLVGASRRKASQQAAVVA
jgi:hypothetical protein